MKLLHLLVAVLLCPVISLQAQSESQYINHLNTYFKGQREYVVPNGRVDILTNEYAIEVERADHWKNAIGQSLWYGLQTNRRSGIVLLVLSQSDYKYFQMLNSTLEHAGIAHKIKVWAYPGDFEGRLATPRTTQSVYGATSSSSQKSTKQHWLTISSQKRHNSSCRYYRNSKGRACSANEGIACKICGGD